MKRQRKWKSFLLLAALCAQITTELAFASEIEWMPLPETYEASFVPVEEATFAAPQAATYGDSVLYLPENATDLVTSWGTTIERLDDYTIVPSEGCTHEDTSCTYTEVPVEYKENPPALPEPDWETFEDLTGNEGMGNEVEEGQGAEEDTGFGEAGEQNITRLETPALRFNPSTLTFSWTEVPGAASYSIHILFWHEDCRPESFPVMDIPALSYTIGDSSLLEGVYEVSADIYAKSANGITSETSAEITHRFYTPTPKPLTEAPVLSFNADARMFTWTEVPGAATYKLSINYTLLDGSNYGSQTMWEAPWTELYSTITQEQMARVAGLTAYVAAVDNIGTVGKASNVIEYVYNDTSYDEEDEFGGANRPTTNQAYIDEVVRLVNVERAKAGLSPLSGGHAGLNAAAIARAREIITLFSHQRPDGTGYKTAMDRFGVKGGMWGENIAAGSTTPQAVVNQWMNSPGHRANILTPEFHYIGVGHAEITGSQYPSYWVQMFLANDEYKAEANTITSFALNGHSGIIDGNRITVVVPRDTNVSRLAATSIVHTGEGVTPASGEARDFSSPVTYTVSSEGTERAYTVRVVRSSSNTPNTSGNSVAQTPSRPVTTGGSTAVTRATTGRANVISANVARNATAKASTGASKTGEKTGGDVAIRPDESLEYAKITGNNVNIRSMPTSRRTNPLGEVHEGNVVAVLGRVKNEEGAFLEITSYEDITGFIPEGYAQLYRAEETDAGSYTVYIWSDGDGSFRTGRSGDTAPDSIHGVLAGSIDFTDGQPSGRNGNIPDAIYGHFAGEYAR